MSRASGIVVASILALAIGCPAHAADLPLKAPPAPPSLSWTGFYAGVQIGGGWSDRTINYVPNDPLIALLVNGTGGFAGQQPFGTNRLTLSGVTGGVEAGYNWQVNGNWLVGLEADFSASGIQGRSNSTTVLAITLGTPLTQTVANEQKIEWWGTARGRVGWLASKDLLLYGTGGFAYGRVAVSDNYQVNLPPGGFASGNLPGVSFRCNGPATCFSGSTSDVKYGWTAGTGGEWRWTQRWTFKAEYLYVNLGKTSVNVVANTLDTPGTVPASYRANFSDTDFHVVRLGANYHF